MLVRSRLCRGGLPHPEAAEALSDLGLTDSKALSPKRRAALVPEIEARATVWALGQGSAREVDSFGIRVATELAMLRALQRLPSTPDLVLVDGVLPLRLWSGEQRTIVRGDSKEASIAAASVLAKEARDALIRRMALRFPAMGWNVMPVMARLAIVQRCSNQDRRRCTVKAFSPKFCRLHDRASFSPAS